MKRHYGLCNLSEDIAGFSMNKTNKYREIADGTAKKPGIEDRIIWE